MISGIELGITEQCYNLECYYLTLFLGFNLEYKGCYRHVITRSVNVITCMTSEWAVPGVVTVARDELAVGVTWDMEWLDVFTAEAVGAVLACCCVVFVMFGGPWWIPELKDGKSDLVQSRWICRISCSISPRIPWFFQRCWLRQLGWCRGIPLPHRLS